MALKRKMSECDDAYSDYEDNCGLQRSMDECSSTEGGGSTRKRRRGAIEKRRRDRINDSLGELKRLVPSAVEKSTSTKLEKAEILQMTVDYLKSTQGQGRTDYIDPRVAMDYQNLGFRDCIAELSRYLVTVEGMDLQEPLRLRLMSHLHSFISRGSGAAAVGSPMAGSWQGGYHHQYQVPPHTAPSSHKLAEPAYSSSIHDTGINNNQAYSRSGSLSAVSSSHSTSYAVPPPPPMYTNTGSYPAYATSSFPGSGLSLHPGAGGGVAPYHITSPTVNGKPYRPWGTEMAY